MLHDFILALYHHFSPTFILFNSPVITAIGNIPDFRFGPVQLPVIEFAHGVGNPDKPVADYSKRDLCKIGHAFHEFLDGGGFLVIEDVAMLASATSAAGIGIVNDGLDTVLDGIINGSPEN